MKEYFKKEIAFERVLFFNDAVVAIAITLLALELKLDIPEGQHVSFKDLLLPAYSYLAFILSFISIASFWQRHHDFFTYIHKMDERMLGLNIAWLFFVVTLPFSTSLLSKHFGDVATVFFYSTNIFLLSIIQNFIWNYADNKENFINKEKLNLQHQTNPRVILNLDMLNGLVAVVFSFFYPKIAFFLLFFKLPIFVFGAFYFGKRKNNFAKK